LSRVVLALGGNALLPRDEPQDSATQEKHLARAIDAIAHIAASHDVVLVHGSGPQVGVLAMRAAASPTGWKEPLDVVGAEIEGMMGYMLQRALRSRMPDRSVVTLLTQIVVNPADPAFHTYTKPIGPVYDREQAEALAATHGWRIGPDGDGWRRLVPSPVPLRILEIEAVRDLLGAGHLVVCAGGGGVPVFEGPDGQLSGAEAVIDKDYSAALLGVELQADVLLLVTDASAVYTDWPTCQTPLRQCTPAEARSLDLPSGSMGPKVWAAAQFAEETGRAAVIGSIDDAERLLAGTAGTRVMH